MAKYRVNQSIITELTNAGIIDGSGNMVLRIPHRPSGPNEDQFFEITIAAATEIIETSNPRAQRSLENFRPPGVKVGGAWLVADPSTTLMMESVPEEDVNPTTVVDVDGTEIVPPGLYKALQVYKRKTGTAVPATREKAQLDAYIPDARAFLLDNA